MDGLPVLDHQSSVRDGAGDDPVRRYFGARIRCSTESAVAAGSADGFSDIGLGLGGVFFRFMENKVVESVRKGTLFRCIGCIISVCLVSRILESARLEFLAIAALE